MIDNGVVVCAEYLGQWTQAELTMDCTSDPAETKTPSSAHCPMANLVGECRMFCGTPSQIVGYWYAQDGDDATLAQNCAQNSGTWVPAATDAAPE